MVSIYCPAALSSDISHRAEELRFASTRQQQCLLSSQ